MINLPAFASEQHVDAPKPKPNASVGNFSHTGTKGFIEGLAFGPLIPTCPTLETDFAGSLNADPISIDEMADELFSLRQP